jgi:hypothetical protein
VTFQTSSYQPSRRPGGPTARRSRVRATDSGPEERDVSSSSGSLCLCRFAGFRAQATILTPTSGDLRVIFTLDPKVQLPQAVINFFIKKVAGMLIYLLREQGLQVASDPARSAVAQRIRASTFYSDYLLPRFQHTFEARGWGGIPATSALDVMVEADGKPPQPVLRQRADRPARRAVRRASVGDGPEAGSTPAVGELGGAEPQDVPLALAVPCRWGALRSAAASMWGERTMATRLVFLMCVVLGLGYTLKAVMHEVISEPFRDKLLCLGMAVVLLVQEG